MKDETLLLIKYRIERSKESLNAAKVLLDSDNLYSAINRVYYGMFYAVIALLLTKNLSSAKHSGVMSLFFKEFINSGLIDKELGRLYSDIFDLRMKYDYKIPAKITKEDVHNWLIKAGNFIEIVTDLTFKIIDHDNNEAK